MTRPAEPTAEENLLAAGVAVGSSYLNRDPHPFPESMRDALVTVRHAYPGTGLSVAYDYVQVDGRRGSGTMTPEHARSVLEPEVSEV